MSDIAIGHAAQRSPFRRGAVVLLVGAGVLGFVLLLLLAAYAPERRGLDNGRANALSNSAVGFRGLFLLAEATGRAPVLVRNDRQWDGDGLLILTPESGYTNLGESTNRGRPTLVVFPKWQIEPLQERDGWTSTPGPLDTEDPETVLAPAIRYEIERRSMNGEPLAVSGLSQEVRFDAPRMLQVLVNDRFASDEETGEKDPDGDENADGDRPGALTDARDRVFEPLITDGRGGIVLGRVGHLFVLSDPDLINNIGMRDAANARAALALLDILQADGSRDPDDATGMLMFDVTRNGFAVTASPLRLLFEPPLLAMTLGLLVLMAMVGLRALAPFGEPVARARALPFGKAALADSSAAMMRKANRTHRLGTRYADAIRLQARRMFAIPAHVRGEALDARLDRMNRRDDFTALAARAAAADNDAELLSAARALDDWKREKTS
ncbi:hypothetical protein [Croceicoccus sp. YJ47]|uniref:hypothetical protein n=1 Tax=Croceicoccus sp. YJ47 TaxID=2798724 RepID=UPI001922790A|nr:hypothetical protein [Croceicoccus sp. YJ47]QQN73754.1 hypothetical protein JD971_13370 [Croceicoccus sp. YJ47]